MTTAARAQMDSALLEQAQGARLDAGVRAQFERAFGASFSDVRVHQGAAAQASADALDARAFTVGRDVVFGAGAYQPGTPEGRAVLAHELAHVLQQRGGGPGGAETPGTEADADQAATAATAGMPAAVTASAGVGVARKPKADTPAPVVVVPLYEFTDEDGKKKQVSEAEMATLRKQAESRLRSKLSRAKGYAENNRSTHEWFMNDVHGKAESLGDVWKNPKSLIGIAVDMRSGVVPPPVSMWGHAIRWAAEGEKALAEGDLRKAARMLSMADADFRNCQNEWNAYMDAIQEGGQKLVAELEIVRDVSFAIAITAAVIVAAPVVATGVAALAPLGVTGAGATALTAVGTGLVGAGTGATLRATGDAAGQKIVSGKVDMKSLKSEAWKGAKEGLVTGLTAGAASGLGSAAGVGTKGATFLQQTARRAVAEGGASAIGQMSDAALEGKSAGEVLKSGAVGFGMGAVTAPLGAGVGKIASSGKPVLSKGVEVVGGGVVVGGITLAGGGTWAEAGKNATISMASSGALAGAKAPAGKPAPKPAPKPGASKPAGESPAAKAATPDVTPDAPQSVAGQADPVVAKPAASTVHEAPVQKPHPTPEVAPVQKPASAENTAGAKPAQPPTAKATPSASAPTSTKPAPSATAHAQPPTATSAPAAQPAVTPKNARIAAQEGVLSRGQKRSEAAKARGDAAATRVVKGEGEVAATKQLVGQTEAAVTQARAKSEAAQAAASSAPAGSKQAAKSVATAARNDLKAAESALKRAQSAQSKAQAQLKSAHEAVAREAGQPAKRQKDVERHEKHLKTVTHSVENPAEAPRLKPGEPFDTKKRRPNLSDFDDVKGHPVDRHTGMRTKADARVGVFKEKVPERLRSEHDALTEILDNPKATQQERAVAGHAYEKLVANDLTPGGGDLRRHTDAGDKPRISDHGSHEFTVEGELSDGKLDQIWRDLLTPNAGARGAGDSALVTVPRLSDKSADRLAKMASVYEKLTGRRPMITVRETAP